MRRRQLWETRAAAPVQFGSVGNAMRFPLAQLQCSWKIKFSHNVAMAQEIKQQSARPSKSGFHQLNLFAGSSLLASCKLQYLFLLHPFFLLLMQGNKSNEIENENEITFGMCVVAMEPLNFSWSGVEPLAIDIISSSSWQWLCKFRLGSARIGSPSETVRRRLAVCFLFRQWQSK